MSAWRHTHRCRHLRRRRRRRRRRHCCCRRRRGSLVCQSEIVSRELKSPF